jgi:hypothetical protein
MNKIFAFGEKHSLYKINVFNEREVRAGAGLLFLFAIISFLNSWLLGNFYYTKLFVVAFLIDFTIRLFINPKYAPSLILGRMLVHNQRPEYVGAPQKRFAWGIGFTLALTMFYLLVLNNIIGPTNLFTCLTCLMLLFFESAFGICIGCKIYNLFNKNKATLCPGEVCEIEEKEDIQIINPYQIIIIALFIVSVSMIHASNILTLKEDEQNINIAGTEDNASDPCVAPEWAIKIGHGDQWKLHHGCK